MAERDREVTGDGGHGLARARAHAYETGRMTARPLDRSRPLVVVSDVHGMAHDLAGTLARIDAAGAFPILLGDLVDRGPDSVGVLRLVVERLARGSLALIRGNHDERLLRLLGAADGSTSPALDELRASPDSPALEKGVRRALATAPYWIILPGYALVHGAFHPDMLTCPSRGLGPEVPRKLRALALYGETTGRLDADGYPIRTHRWVERIPTGLTVIVGHDVRQTHEPLVVDNGAGGRAVFLDTGAGKGGRLSTWHIPPILPAP